MGLKEADRYHSPRQPPPPPYHSPLSLPLNNRTSADDQSDSGLDESLENKKEDAKVETSPVVPTVVTVPTDNQETPAPEINPPCQVIFM